MADENEVIPDVAQYRAKLTIATIGGSPERAKTEKKRVEVCRFFGWADGVKHVDNPMGNPPTFVALTGNFEAHNTYDGSVWRSGVCYLPSGLHEMVLSMLDDATSEFSDVIAGKLKELEQDPDRSRFDKPRVAFALAIDAEPTDNPAGYSYIGRNLAGISKADPLASLRAVALKGLPKPLKAIAAS